MKIQIIYIATSKHYFSMFDKFVTCLEDFAKNDTKIVDVLTDCDFDVTTYKLQNIKINLHHINHYPWPIITLFKFHHIYNVLDSSCDVAFYCNCNLLLHKCNTLPKELTQKDKLFLFRSNKQSEHEKKWQDTNIYDTNLKWVIGGFVGGSFERMKDLCLWCISHINDHLLNNFIEYKHDESALNHYYSEISNCVNDYNILDFNDYAHLDHQAHRNGDIGFKESSQLGFVKY